MSVLYSRVGIILWRSGEVSHFRWTTAPAINVISSSDDNLHDDTDTGFLAASPEIEGDPSTQSSSSGRNVSPRGRSHYPSSSSRSDTITNEQSSSSSSGGGRGKQYLRVKASSRKVRQSHHHFRINNNNNISKRKSSQMLNNRSQFDRVEGNSSERRSESGSKISWELTEVKRSEVKIENHFHGGRAELKSRQATVKMLIRRSTDRLAVRNLSGPDQV
ncbi:unnamed protein product [Allacma fusca]|uniref:Uncharacterized protein n=1 Tax=Allacma fusca TaxID=39272 RepID=A0A8J2KMI3_9HEXA|nr:unnamed protein product [Allacma fusca]